LEAAAMAVARAGEVGLDLETTGLDPRTDRTRLVTVGAGGESFVIDAFAVDPAPLWPALAQKTLVGHNLAFDLGFLRPRDFTPEGALVDTMLLAGITTAGTPARLGLADCCERWTDHRLDKTLQLSNWSRALSADQIEYAAKDVAVLPALAARLRDEVRSAGLERTAEIEARALPALVWMSAAGVPFDAEKWLELADESEREAKAALELLHAAAPRDPDSLFDSDWNWNSPAQVAEALALAGCKVADTSDSTLAALDHPLAEALREYRGASKLAQTYGRDWLKHVAADGRVYPSWWQLGAWSGRMACSDPNLQQIPRGRRRGCFAAPAGQLLVKADYSQIELRIVAKMVGEKRMLEAYRRGDDLHLLTARTVTGKDAVEKSDRQLAKALNFGLLYGMGAAGFRRYAKTNYGVVLSEQEAAGYREAFFATYPGLRRWHREVGRDREAPIETRTLFGRRRLQVVHFSEKLNTPVQGTGADGIKLALARLWETRRDCPGAFPILAVHDEIVLEAPAEEAEAASTWLQKAMTDSLAGALAPAPVETETTIARTWGA
ncbi:MAG TPA: DNA polymerase, partial [Planctomycetia bacterium]|nr:DNA polymerase [Planctomycetia bacterium]